MVNGHFEKIRMPVLLLIKELKLTAFSRIELGKNGKERIAAALVVRSQICVNHCFSADQRPINIGRHE